MTDQTHNTPNPEEWPVKDYEIKNELRRLSDLIVQQQHDLDSLQAFVQQLNESHTHTLKAVGELIEWAKEEERGK